MGVDCDAFGGGGYVLVVAFAGRGELRLRFCDFRNSSDFFFKLRVCVFCIFLRIHVKKGYLQHKFRLRISLNKEHKVDSSVS